MAKKSESKKVMEVVRQQNPEDRKGSRHRHCLHRKAVRRRRCYEAGTKDDHECGKHSHRLNDS